MTPNEKAKELFDKFYSITGPFTETKQCALIAVDEILWEIIKYTDNSQQHVIENSEFWNKVKQEIEKL